MIIYIIYVYTIIYNTIINHKYFLNLANISTNIPARIKLKTKNKEGFLRPDLTKYNDSTVFNLGPRWNCIKEMYLGEKDLITFLEIPDEFKNESKIFSRCSSLIPVPVSEIFIQTLLF